MSQVNAEKAVNSVLRSYVCTYNSCFLNILASHEKRTGKTVNGTVHLVLTDPPYNTRWDREIRNSAYDDLAMEDVQEAASIATSLLRPGGHAINFCAPQQFKDWKCALENIQKLSLTQCRWLLFVLPVQTFSHLRGRIRPSLTCTNCPCMRQDEARADTAGTWSHIVLSNKFNQGSRDIVT
jgi:tRNA1(Val) A37 N6-methylase TrmN6